MLAPVLVTPVRIGLLSAVVFGFAMGIPVSLADSAVAGAVAGVTAAVVLGAIAGWRPGGCSSRSPTWRRRIG